MKYIVSAALVAAQLAATAQPAFAAEIQREAAAAAGSFAGLRLRVSLDGGRARQAPSLGLAIAPTVHNMDESGTARIRIGEGLELGVQGRRPVRLMLAGQDVRRLGAARQGEAEDADEHGGPSTLGWIAIGVGALVVVTAAAGYFIIDDILDCDDGEDCT